MICFDASAAQTLTVRRAVSARVGCPIKTRFQRLRAIFPDRNSPTGIFCACAAIRRSVGN
jgi:hypothetical protein